MPLDKPYLDIPGTTIFDAEQARKGYALNQFCMSLMRAENRARFKADERAYLDEWAMTEAQKQAVLARDLNAAIAEGGNIYFLAKLGFTDGRNFQQMAASMTGMTESGVSRHDDRGRPVRNFGNPGRVPGPCRDELREAKPRSAHAIGNSGAGGLRARITASVYTSHVPAIGAAIDQGRRRSLTGGRCSQDTSVRGAGWPSTRPTSSSRLQRPRHRLQPRPDPDLRHRRPPPSSSRPTRGGGRGRSPRSSVTRSSARTSRRA